MWKISKLISSSYVFFFFIVFTQLGELAINNIQIFISSNDAKFYLKNYTNNRSWKYYGA